MGGGFGINLWDRDIMGYGGNVVGIVLRWGHADECRLFTVGERHPGRESEEDAEIEEEAIGCVRGSATEPEGNGLSRENESGDVQAVSADHAEAVSGIIDAELRARVYCDKTGSLRVYRSLDWVHGHCSHHEGRIHNHEDRKLPERAVRRDSRILAGRSLYHSLEGHVYRADGHGTCGCECRGRNEPFAPSTRPL